MSMNVILDANIWISFLFGKRLQTVESLFLNRGVRVYVSMALVSELRDVLSRPKIKQHVSLQSVDAMWNLIYEYCEVINDYAESQTDVRDAKDVYLLSMVDAIPADVIVTGDKDLLVLKQHGCTQIMNYSDFMLLLSSADNKA